MFKKKIIFIFLFLASCASNFQIYEKTGFSEVSFNNKITSNLKIGQLLKVTNIENGKSVLVKVEDQKKITSARVIYLSKNIYKKINLDEKFPLVRVETFRENKKFTAKKAKTYDEERYVKNKINTNKVEVLSLSDDKKTKKNIYLKYGDFYSEYYATGLMKMLRLRLGDKIVYKSSKKNSHYVYIGPISSLKNYDKIHLKLKQIGLAGYDIIIK